jgi:hypothetical protein
MPKELVALVEPSRNTLEFLGRQTLNGGFDLLDSVHEGSLAKNI